MLGKLFGSNARVKLLKLFLTRPEEKFYIREIARDLGLQLNSVRRELENLENFGLLTSDPERIKGIAEGKINEDVKIDSKKKVDSVKGKTGGKKEKKYYMARTDFILYEEIKALIVKSQILYERDFVEKIKEVGNPDLLLLTGFFVNSSSPADILVVGNVNKDKLTTFITGLEIELGRELNFSIMDFNEFKYRRDITDVFLYEILEGEKIIVINNIDLI